jgi:hypothetical protein
MNNAIDTHLQKINDTFYKLQEQGLKAHHRNGCLFLHATLHLFNCTINPLPELGGCMFDDLINLTGS